MLPLFFAIYRSVRWVRKRQSKLRRHTFRYWYHLIDKLKFSIIILFRLFLKPLLVKQLCKSLFLRFVAEINLPLLFSSRETSLAARSKEKRLYSQATWLRAASHESVGANSPAPQIKQHVPFSYGFEYETSYSSIWSFLGLWQWAFWNMIQAVPCIRLC